MNSTIMEISPLEPLAKEQNSARSAMGHDKRRLCLPSLFFRNTTIKSRETTEIAEKVLNAKRTKEFAFGPLKYAYLYKAGLSVNDGKQL